jgi:CPA2 family monovalent cation:H+ antiporter-2
MLDAGHSGLAVSGPMAEQTHRLLAPLRYLFAATFFFFFGLQINPATLSPMLLSAVSLGGAIMVTRVPTGYWQLDELGWTNEEGCGRGWPWWHAASSRV